MKGQKGNARQRAARTDPAKRKKTARPAAPATATGAGKRVKSLDMRAAAAADRAKTFAAIDGKGTVPTFIAQDKQYAGVLALWKHYAPLLEQRHFWEPEFVATFTGFCIYGDEFIAADREVKKKGWGVEGKSTSGGNRFWTNPAVAVRDHAFARVMELSSRFGFTALDLYKLERESAAAGSGARLPQTGQKPTGDAPRDEQQDGLPLEPAPGTVGDGLPGSLSVFDGIPPNTKPS